MEPLHQRLAITINAIAEASAKGAQASLLAIQQLAMLQLKEVQNLEAEVAKQATPDNAT